MTTSTPQRTRNAAATRDRIVEAARDVFVSRGYRAASLRDVAAAAGITHPGLLKHFASKDLLLTAVIASFDRATEEALLDGDAVPAPGTLMFAAIAARNEGLEGYLPLYAALVGESSTRDHPAHAYMRERYARLREFSVVALRDAAAAGTVDPARDFEGEAVRVAAVWDGLQLLELYLPDRVDLVPLLTEVQHALATPPGWHGDAAATTVGRGSGGSGGSGSGGSGSAVSVSWQPLDSASADETGTDGYRVGRERRARILRDATALFARDGYAATSLREIAERVGVSKSALLHHYSSKDALLGAVLAERDRAVSVEPLEGLTRAADILRDIPRGAAANAATAPGLIEVYAVLSCEALPDDHPAHDYFERRFTLAIDRLAAMLSAARDDGDLPAHRDPEREAIRLVALWDGLQYQWLYDRESVDVAAHLAAHLDDILPRR
ncbi:MULTISPECIES: TetR/AcrR family transcriptional regulator [Microbacterium]|uniref:TetR/AcrR family transcriptional regulator n=1 Tax=Microbacterium TaxID=33882 RepID=UPI00168AC76D|nr:MULTISPECIES: TetR/AcrR family transcriptional regulator [Microbacterium]QOC26645.1 TetR/AcrR family transcriptional regulator [Microbacterium hominis]QYF97028.1 TetR/AcrR family transcriptional regulator [Microbacterium sp. PAMC21962]